MEKEKVQGQVQFLAQAAALLLLLLYVIGFLVLSIHNALFGIVQFGLLRARMLSAGILFAVFFAVALVPAARVFGLFGYEEWYLFRSSDKPGRRFVFRWVIFFTTALAFCFVMRIFLEDHTHWTVVNELLLVSALLGTWVGQWQVESRPRLSVLLGLTAIILMFILVHRLADLGLYILLSWFTSIALIAQYINPLLQDPGKLRHLQSEVWVVSSLAIIAIFAVLLYPRIWPALGGGRPAPVTLQFSDRSPFDGSSRAQVWLIDETDLGFYVLTAKDQGKAVFLPRNLVSAVYFGEAPAAPKATQPNAGTRSGQTQP